MLHTYIYIYLGKLKNDSLKPEISAAIPFGCLLEVHLGDAPVVLEIAEAGAGQIRQEPGVPWCQMPGIGGWRWFVMRFNMA